MEAVFKKPDIFIADKTHYCPGCTHGIAHRLIAETIEELSIADKTIGIAPVGCAVFITHYIDVDFSEAAHGRAPAVATGIKRVLPDSIVFSYQGDGDLASIGAAEIIHAAARGENITVIFINNAIYGMTGGQMAPTTLVGQKSTTSPDGRDAAHCGYPVRMSEILATLDGAAYIERCALCDVAHVTKAKKAIKKAFQMQIDKKGFSMVELLSTCSTNWGMTPDKAQEFVKEKMIPYYPLGVFKEVE